MQSFISFAHRRNYDSTVDSICARCYQTIANGESYVTLSGAEENHLCDPNAEIDRREEIFRYHHSSESLL